MGSQNPKNSDRSRVNWTAAMERYFIDLMLNQMHMGNRMGHTFNKQAWTEMMNMFNAKFRTKYDRDTLKSHYSMLWKQHNDIKNLLEQNGFNWDDTHKMVMAAEHSWDAFIKTNPDAEAYRNKAYMHFNDLCIIYAYTLADGRYSRSSHDIDLDDDVQVVTTGVEIDTIAPASREPTKTDWTPVMDQYLIELMLDQLRKGNKNRNTFSKQAWKDMLMLFNAKFCSQYHKSYLRHRFKKLLKYYADLRSLLEQNGFSWDEKQQMIFADDSVWDKYIKAHPSACSYRKRTLLNYRDLGMIFSDASNNGPSVHMCHNRNFKDNSLHAKTGEEKETYSSAGSDSLRMHWTSSMDSYLIDLLLDQALRGNNIGPAFITEAWTEMVAVFNTNFGSHFDIDALKNRSKHLRRKYNDIKILLEQSGFFWDDIRETVVAEDYVWDSYTKAYPHAQLYKNKSMPNYHKLCVLYGQEISNGRSSRLARCLDLGEEFQSHANRDCSRIDWTPLMDRHFIDLMLEHVYKGNRIGYTFNNEAWIDMAVSFVERFGLQYDKDLLRIHHRSLGNQYIDMKNLLEHGGFFWDERRQRVTAYGDVWDAYIKEHPDAKSYRTRATPNYNDLCLIYGNSTSDGRGNQSHHSCNGDGAKSDNGHHWRTDWTPPMDRYFIDLMLEQVRQGSMIDRKFSKQAWAIMVSKFREEFGPQRNKDILKSRFVNLKKRFNDMKNLVDYSGFAWDEMQQMIVADPYLWDAYIKEYPDAWPYRNSTLPNYNDMFLIYGNANADAEQNCFSHSKDSEDVLLEVKDDEEDDRSSNCSDPSTTYWSKSMEKYFINLMLEQVHRGNMFGHRFNEQAWAWMIASINEKFGLLCDEEVLEQQYFSLMGEYNNITDLLSRFGFAWDSTQQTIIADDNVWEACVKDYPDAISYRGRNLDIYHHLCMIYGERSSVESSSSEDVKTENDKHVCDTGVDNIFRDLHTPAAEFDISNKKKKRKSPTSSTLARSRKVQRPIKEEMQGALDEMAGVIKMTWAGYKEDGKDYSSIENIVDALQAIPDMNDELFLEACQLLEDEKKAKMFIEMDVTCRRKWLLRKLHR
ncbi:hypothetical protein Ddye_028305 [Dipteronia dyeriana]|uniref:L10-interacting MYB domain-containing protein n=1 Tax=Dipteronia dyeriana TaxID=168575 RepID=A0AAD9TRM2_9ROSI|nr:hypothetical protein Ddye_028305 [Dipteronia dyeriana]